MVKNDEDNLLEAWIKDARARHNLQIQHLHQLSSAIHLDDAGFRALDSTLKKVTAFMKKLKNIGTNVTPVSLLPELEKLNVSKFLDEIAMNICEAKLKISEIPYLIVFCVKVASLYSAFPGILIMELKKHIPFKKTDAISNPSKLRVDLRFLADLVLNGVLQKEGIQLLGNTFSYIINTDKTNANVSVLMPLCRSLLFDITNLVPLTYLRASKEANVDIQALQLSSTVFSDEQRNAVINLFRSYFDSLVQHVNEVRLEMNRVQKSIKRQERTRGDASADDRQKFEQAKISFDRLLQSATDLSECLGTELPAMVEEPSDDEQDELASKKLGSALNDGRMKLWPDIDTQAFYERLADVRRLILRPASESIDEDEKEDTEIADAASPDSFTEQEITESIDNIDLTNLDATEDLQHESDGELGQVDDEEEDTSTVEEEVAENDATSIIVNDDDLNEEMRKVNDMDFTTRGHIASTTIKEFLARLTVCINRDLIDSAAAEFITHFNKKAYKKRLVQQLINAPVDRLDLLPFYARFLATLKTVIPGVTTQVTHELLYKFRDLIRKPVEAPKKTDKKINLRIDQKVHLSKYISELAKFSILPKAEALSCLRSLLVDLKYFKIDMLCAMIESMGLFLYRSTDCHTKMVVFMEVMRTKATKIKDPRHQILLDNAYFCVIPPDEQSSPVQRLPAIYEFLQRKIISSENRLSTFRKINWDDIELCEFVMKILSSPASVRFEDLDRLASLVGALSDQHSWIGIQVVDDVLEFIRLSLEFNHTSLQQRCLSSVIYLGQLFNYNVCGTPTVFLILYQLITFNLTKGIIINDLITRVQRIRLVCDMVNTVCEFFCKGSSKTKMDCFLYFYLRFYYETLEQWVDYNETLGEFPRDIKYNVEEMLKTWRLKEKFPKSLAEANEYIDHVERKYKSKVEEILQGIRTLQGEDDRDERRLNYAVEEEDEDYRDDETFQNPRRVGSQLPDDEVYVESQSLNAVTDDNEEEIHVHTEHHILPEDEEFLRDLERIMNETMQSTPAALKGPMTDLEVPPLARQKFERKITFASEPAPLSSRNESAADQSSNSILPTDGHFETGENRPIQMALMTRGKGNKTVLKAVKMESSENMHESWRHYQEQRKRERQEMKHVTLAMNDRIQHQQQEEQLKQMNEALNGVRLGNSNNAVPE